MRKGGAYHSGEDDLDTVRDLHGEALVRLGLRLQPRKGQCPMENLHRARPEVKEAALLLGQLAGIDSPRTHTVELPIVHATDSEGDLAVDEHPSEHPSTLCKRRDGGDDGDKQLGPVVWRRGPWRAHRVPRAKQCRAVRAQRVLQVRHRQWLHSVAVRDARVLPRWESIVWNCAREAMRVQLHALLPTRDDGLPVVRGVPLVD